jgi:hypothetical protein
LVNDHDRVLDTNYAEVVNGPLGLISWQLFSAAGSG